MKHPALLLALALVVASSPVRAQDAALTDETFSGITIRSIGPALMSGRIADIAVHPADFGTWYVAVGSGGVWKTVNAGTTWEPLFDGQPSYSIGCVTLDPSNPEIVWVGTGENVGGRHVGFGDGVYRSLDGGSTWESMGLAASEHVSKILVHPDDSNTIWVASQGPLWSAGGDRGVFRSTDGGASWTRVLGDDEWVGATDLVMDPRDPDRLYAATWQRQRTVASYMGGGPGTAIYRSEDGGATWQKLAKGLPGGDMGKIGLALSPQRPDVVYAAIELERRTGGIYRSEDLGMTWEKMSDTVSGATGPHYYQELYASPHAFDRLYLMNTRTLVSDDGGRTFRPQTDQWKHVDDHALAFRPDDPDWLLIGTDGGLYESHDLAANWRFVANLPVTQFYKIAVDDAEPFYTVYGGTQDNSTQGGPSRTDNNVGISNADWFITLFADGHQPATEPGNPDIMYSEWQQGNLVRVDRTTGEIVHIQPQPGPGEGPERYNWDSPILVSPHKPTRIYYASHRVWRSEDRGDSWTAISGDLTRDQERMSLPIMGRAWSWDSAWDYVAMSEYNTITSLAESPLQEGLVYAGTDDGLIQVTEDGGATWRAVPVQALPGVPQTAFVNDIKADLHDVNTVYVALDNHKFGDYRPFLYRSTDRGRTWRSIVANLPERTLVWRLVQDHVNPALLFVGTEFGLYVTLDGGAKWLELTGGMPTIAIRDLAIQRREDDLVAGSFGRGIYILDDYAFLRDVSAARLAEDAALFSTRRAWWYLERNLLGDPGKASQGAAWFTAPNPPFGAVFTYHLSEGLKSGKAARQEAEKLLRERQTDVPFPGWDALEAETREQDSAVLLTVRDAAGNVVRRLEGPAGKGFHRVAWDLRMPNPGAIAAGSSGGRAAGFLAAPGSYAVSLSSRVDGVVTELAGPVPFEVEPLRPGAIPSPGPAAAVAFWKEIGDLQRETSAAGLELRDALARIESMQAALTRATAPPGELDASLHAVREALLDLRVRMQGSSAKGEVGESGPPTIQDRLGSASFGTTNSTYGPTATHRRSLEIAASEFAPWRAALDEILSVRIPALEAALQAAGAPPVR
jgi:photosystem II stability/assembly factor-like uncharacterized protein